MFKVGDIVTGRNMTDYFYTNAGAIMRVVESNYDETAVLVLESPLLHEMGSARRFTVNTESLRLVEEKVEDPTKTPIERKIAFMHNRWVNRKGT